MDQGFSDRVLHRFALQNHYFRKFSFERECQRNQSRAKPDRKNVFIVGLARAGSTALLNSLYASGQFAATTYRLMPFVLAPSMSAKLSAFASTSPVMTERAHGDGLQVGAGSPEALDGIFWSTFQSTTPDAVQIQEVPGPIINRYAQFIENLLAHENRERYLSKMNQGIGKLESLSQYFENSVFLIPYRDPLQQAASLLRQHRRFSRLSGYQRRYLGWQGHHEFGALHRGFLKPTRSIDWHTLNYWLDQWQLTYSYLSELMTKRQNLIPIAYESLTESSEPWRQLGQKLDLQLEPGEFRDCNRDDTHEGSMIDERKLEDCMILYTRLGERAQGRLCSPD